MSLNLRNGEVILAEVNFHWLSYMFPGFFALIGLLTLWWGFPLYYFAPVLMLPVFYVYAENRVKKYIVTNQRLYIQTGVLARNENEIPLKKINNVVLNQTFIQRLYNSGDVHIQAGNDNPTVIRNIENPRPFKDAISNGIEQQS